MDTAPVRRQLVWPRSENPMLLMAPLLTHKNRMIERTSQAHIHASIGSDAEPRAMGNPNETYRPVCTWTRTPAVWLLETLCVGHVRGRTECRVV